MPVKISVKTPPAKRVQSSLSRGKTPGTGAHLRKKQRLEFLEEEEKVTSQVQKLNRTRKAKVINDPIHGHFELSTLAVSIIDTPEFQRLRRLKQLGTTSYTFPGLFSLFLSLFSLLSFFL